MEDFSWIPVAQEGEMYSLKWDTFQSCLTKGLKTLFLERDIEDTDVTLGAEGRHVRAHRWLLSICSPYFKRLFSASPDKKSSHVVILNNVKFRDLENLVYFMYNGEVKVATDSELQGVLQVGALLEVEGLTPCDTPVETVTAASAPPSTHGQESRPLISTASSNPTSSSGPQVQGSHGLEGAARSSPTPTPTINLSSSPPTKRQRTFQEDPNTVTKALNVLAPIVTMAANEDENNLGHPEDDAVPLRDSLAFDTWLMTGETSECQDVEDSLSLLQGHNVTDEVMIDVDVQPSDREDHGSAPGREKVKIRKVQNPLFLRTFIRRAKKWQKYGRCTAKTDDGVCGGKLWETEVKNKLVVRCRKRTCQLVYSLIF